ncbi:hypothetical protein M0R45_007394 [Rubus argutus]|uniref:Endonuclease/exonuclease/phosphatase domain-containing protein n=1 Tax=Rubus argutus TaxID=59490 RepID=A0AAW1Y104_RUBAR
MKILYWNARGIANGDMRRALKNLVSSHKPSIVCLSEPFILANSIPVSYWRSMRLSFVTTNDRGTHDPNLWLLCNDALMLSVISKSAQQITFSYSIDGVHCVITTVYAKTSVVGRRHSFGRTL